MTGAGLGGEQSVLRLPPPQTEGGKPLMQVPKLRQSARDWQEIGVYVATAEAVYRYDARDRLTCAR